MAGTDMEYRPSSSEQSSLSAAQRQETSLPTPGSNGERTMNAIRQRQEVDGNLAESDNRYDVHLERGESSGHQSSMWTSGSAVTTSGRLRAHLPTPHSPNNVIPYFPGVVASPESPLLNVPQRSLSSVSAPATLSQRLPPRPRSPRAASPRMGQMATPETSPASKRTSPPVPITPRPRSAPLSSTHFTNFHAVRVKPEESLTALAPAHIISPPMSTQSISVSPETARASFSSPFMPQFGPVDEPQYLLPFVGGESHHPKYSPPVESGDLFSSATFRGSPPLSSTPFPPNRLGSSSKLVDEKLEEKVNVVDPEELLVDRQQAPGLSSTVRRSASGIDSHAESTIPGPSHVGLQIIASPTKGRRLKLFDFKQTSAESFEESLMTHGYGTYGEPRTPQKRISATDGLSQEAIDWLTHNTPAGPSTIPVTSEMDIEVSERELKKRKRLQAFQRGPLVTQPKLQPVEVEGKGRILLNLPTEEAETAPAGSPVKKRVVGRKRKGATDKKSRVVITQAGGPDRHDEPRWLDSEFPWCLRGKERDDETKLEDQERLRWIEKFLDRETDSDDEEEGDVPRAMPPTHELDEPCNEPHPRLGRGKMVPLQADPSTTRAEPTNQRDNVFIPSDPADARAALLSKRSVRILAHRKRQFRSGLSRENEGEVRCICGEGDDGTPQVQCDDCHLWYHWDCIGIQDEKELGDEDDPWYCSSCITYRKSGREPSPETSSPIYRQPTLVPTDDLVPSGTGRDVAFYQSSPQGSAQRGWSTSAPPQTPDRNEQTREAYSSRRPWESGPRAGPSTPLAWSHGVQVYSTPRGPFDDYGPDEPAFDPTSTPSRGIKLGMPFVTPKSDWTSRAGGLLFTPRNAPGIVNRNPFLLSSEESGNLGAHFRNIYSSDDTPVRRAHTTDRPRLLAPRHMLDSPLASRSFIPFPDIDDSPIIRSKEDYNGSAELRHLPRDRPTSR
ncbi:hypothetical protein BD410DRAFT_832395 [Rickenella mellea]|uniref:PHD-type domain-containing protein n=1 Tax=Rickenella mellea TaxID=50990 RepID=A0A4Y7PK42_9AGAM|nr:hypothetical protein BD410DRAFT_832395 [Rickenella mellea]